MAIWDYFSKKKRTVRRLSTLLAPTEHEKLHELVTFGDPKKSAQRIATKKSTYDNQMICTFLIFEKKSLTHFTSCPLLDEKQYQKLLKDLSKKYKDPKRKDWKNLSDALETIA